MANAQKLLSRIDVTVTQAGLDTALTDLVGNISVPIKWDKDIGILGSLQVTGSIGITNVKIRLADNLAHTSASVSPSMKVTHRGKLTRENDAALNFSVVPGIDARIESHGSKALVILQLPQVKLARPHWPGALDKIAAEFWKLVGDLEKGIAELVNDHLLKHPIEVIDLKDIIIPIPKGKKLDALLDFTSLEFKDSALCAGVEIKS